MTLKFGESSKRRGKEYLHEISIIEEKERMVEESSVCEVGSCGAINGKKGD